MQFLPMQQLVRTREILIRLVLRKLSEQPTSIFELPMLPMPPPKLLLLPPPDRELSIREISTRIVADLGDLGTVISVSITAQDVTTQVVDLDARIGVLQTSIDRLKSLQAQATSVTDLVAVESELANRQGELDSLTAQRGYLGQQVAMSTVTVSLSPITELTSSTAPGFLAGLQNGWSAFLALIAFVITSAGFLIPFVVIGAIVVIPVILLVMKRKK